MARPLSDNKRQAILVAAMQTIAQHGLTASTSSMATLAGVAEGTLFTYFPNKDDLLNHLYLSIKRGLSEAILGGFPSDGELLDRTRHVWQAYVRWGVDHPDQRRAMAQLAVSDRISAATREAGIAPFAAVTAMLNEGGGSCGPNPSFASAILGSMAETTMDFIARDPGQASSYLESGFQAFWRALGARNSA